MPGAANTLEEAGVRETTLDIITSMSVIRSCADLELLISTGCGDTYLHHHLRRVLPHTLKDVAVMFHLPLFADHGARGIILSEDEERILQLLNAALRVSKKSTYTS